MSRLRRIPIVPGAELVAPPLVREAFVLERRIADPEAVVREG